MTPKAIGVGLGGTGTRSLKLAPERPGFALSYRGDAEGSGAAAGRSRVDRGLTNVNGPAGPLAGYYGVIRGCDPRRQAQWERLMYSKILVPIAMDDLDSAAKALDVAASLAQAFGGEVAVMTLETRDRDAARRVPDTAAMRFKEFVDAQSERLDRRLGEAFCVGDDLSAEIGNIIQDQGVDLVVMRTHDPIWLDHLLGSRSSSVALHAPCSVLVVR